MLSSEVELLNLYVLKQLHQCMSYRRPTIAFNTISFVSGYHVPMGHDLALFKIELMFPVVLLLQMKNQ